MYFVIKVWKKITNNLRIPQELRQQVLQPALSLLIIIIRFGKYLSLEEHEGGGVLVLGVGGLQGLGAEGDVQRGAASTNLLDLLTAGVI